ncbi:MAG: threonylcarbamoyl-AMP synthase [Chloroflexi bacterium]|nr:threonylcarbamoyl-AMP synthase [Chloroflexota bacterium]MBM3182529.1 threonylcarbamoyl-AMP synthase [Chloroflexota bacterium]MBM4451147.1 threonylcarbamoyl-AMP synthase [Chloroflexota bacterium]MBM4454313.1 threonylcarbamoyl-AMP synthase [Chloroflexota bacterium]
MSRSPSQIERQVERAVEILKAGGIVAYPTDTVYGLGADAFNPEAVARIFEVKGRPRSMALPVLLADVEQVNEVASVVPEAALIFTKRFWPGGLTLVLFKAVAVPDMVTAGSDKVAVRVPNHEVPCALIRGLGAPIIGTSANISDRPSPVTAEGVRQQLRSGVDLVIDAGRCPGGVESTVVDVTGDSPVVLREGIVSKGEIEKIWRESLKEAGKSANCCG